MIYGLPCKLKIFNIIKGIPSIWWAQLTLRWCDTETYHQPGNGSNKVSAINTYHLHNLSEGKTKPQR